MKTDDRACKVPLFRQYRSSNALRREDFVMPNRRPWLGGYVRKGKKAETFVIDRWVKGVHFHISTRCRTERAALKQLERFEANPYGYSPLDSDELPLTITSELLEEFRVFMRQERKNTPEWTGNVIRYLTHWAEDLAGKDLRHLSVARDLEKALQTRKTSRRHRIEAIKSFCAWLRRTERLNIADDATINLHVPQIEPAKNKRRRAVSMADVEAVMPHLSAEVLDVLLLQSGTAWHISEVRRFAGSGEIVRPISGDPLAVLVTRHKSGDLTRTPIRAPEHLAAAERILARGRIPIPETLADAMKRACEKVRAKQAEAGVPEKNRMPHWRLGVMRHTVLSHAVEQGASPQEVSEFAGHRSVQTSRRFYIDVATPTVSVPVMRLTKKDA